MKLKSLWIQEYKNLKDFQLNFEKGNHLSILIGNNGSGKSNVLEAISGIFAEWFGKSSYKFDTDYELIYDKSDLEFRLNRNGNYKRVKPFKNNYDFLPTKVIATYSGENSYLYKTFYKPFKRSFKMFYCDKNLWNVSFLILNLYAYKYSDIASFLKEEFAITNKTRISITIKTNYYSGERDVENLMDRINNNDSPEEFTLSLDDLQMRLGRGKADDDLYYQPRELFDIFSRACTRSRPVISRLDIVIDSYVNLANFSEGEKKIILIKAILEFIADEDSLLLLDEPDANIHESRKIYFYQQIKKYAEEYGRQIVMTTHSPIIAKIADEKELIYLESKNGTVSEVSMDKLNLIKKLASDEWDIMDAGVFLNSEKPLVLFEGKSDVDFVKRAIELLKEDEPKYAKIDVDILCFNGTGNASSFIKNIRDCVASKKIVLFFDRDDAGKTSMSELSGKDKKSADIQNCIDYISDDGLLKAVFYPYSNEVTSGEFLLEDYFYENKIIEIIDNLISGKKHPVKSLSNLSKRVKDTLANKYKEYPKEDFEGFKPLLDKLLELLEIH